MTSSYFPPCPVQSGCRLCHPGEPPPPFLCQHLCPSEEVEGQLPEESIRGILDQSGEPGPMSMMVKMADAEVLFHFVPDLGDSLVPFSLAGSQLSTPGGFSPNAVLDIVKAQKCTVILSKVSLVGINLFYRMPGMTTAGDAQGKKRAVVEGGRGHFRGQDKAIAGIHLSSLRGWLADCTRRASMAMPSWMANPREANCDRSSWLMAFMVFLERRLLNREKVE